MKKLFVFVVLLAVGLMVSSARGAPESFLTIENEGFYTAGTTAVSVGDELIQGVTTTEVTYVMGTQQELEVLLPEAKKMAKITGLMEVIDLTLEPPNLTVLLAYNFNITDSDLVNHKSGGGVSAEEMVCGSSFSNDAINQEYTLASVENSVISAG